MPQLDSFSFFTQVFWVLFFFTLFYFVNLRQVLPSLATIVKVRRRALQKSQTASDNLELKGNSLPEPHVQFFSLARALAPSEDVESSNLSQSQSDYNFYKAPLDLQQKYASESRESSVIFMTFARKNS